MGKISVIVITFNEEKNIDRCLKSITWANEIIVVDAFSTDKTVELARAYATDVLLHVYDGEVPQRERGFQRATGEWLFWIDADEEVSVELKNQILEVVHSPHALDGYAVARKASVLGKWIEHGGWFPDWQFRLVKRDKIVAEYQEIHGGFTTKGTRGNLPGILYHFTYSSLSEYLRKMNDQTSLHVSNKLREQPKLRIGWHKIVLSPLSYFLRMFIVQKGYKDGMHGFILACYSALYTTLMYAKTWEYRSRQEEGLGILPPIKNAEVQKMKMKYSAWTTV